MLDLRAAGASLQPERATLQQVREKLKMAKTKKQEKEEEEDIGLEKNDKFCFI